MANEIDVFVGNAVRNRRVFLGMTQYKLAKALGLTFQQVQKYETGVNRIGASRLYEIANILKVEVPYFFENIGGGGKNDIVNLRNDIDSTSTRETIDLIKHFSKISDKSVKKNIITLMQSLSKKEAELNYKSNV